MKYIYRADAIQQESWKFGCNNYHIKYDEVPLFTLYAIGSKNVAQYLQNQYGWYSMALEPYWVWLTATMIDDQLQLEPYLLMLLLLRIYVLLL